MTLRIVVLFINHVIRREFVKALRFPYLRSEIFSDERGSKLDTLFLLVVVFRSISKSSKVQLYIIIMKPFIEVAGGNHLPAICYAQRGGMAYLGDYHYSKEHWQSYR